MLPLTSNALSSPLFGRYVDDKEQKVGIKGSVPMIDITEVRTMEGSDEIVLLTKRRSYNLRSTTPAAMDCWFWAFSAIAKQKNAVPQAQMASAVEPAESETALSLEEHGAQGEGEEYSVA